MALKVLFLDDEEMLGDLFVDFFQSETVHIKVFSVPKEAVESSNTEKYDLIFLDFRMPGLTGDKAAALMPADIPKYLVTGEIEVNVDFKFNGIIRKPYRAEIIQEIIDGYLAAMK